MAGELSGFRPLSYDDKAVFDEAIKDIVDVGYTPLVVASQVVSGIRYKFICETVIMNKDFTRGLASVCIVKTPDGKIEKPDIKNLVEE